MRMRKKMLALLTAALLLAGMLPVGALAAPGVVTTEVIAEVYESDTHCEMELDTYYALSDLGCDAGEMDSFNYVWDPALVNTGRFTNYGMWGYYNCTKADAGKQMYYCNVFDQNGRQIATVNFKVTEIIYAPVTPDVPSVQYVYYTPGETVNFSFPKATIGGNGQYEVNYSWGYYDDITDKILTVPNAPSISLTLDETMNLGTVSCSVNTKTYSNFKLLGNFVLMMRTNNPIVMPSLPGRVQRYTLAPGESHTFTLPAATPGIAGKTLEYRWWKYDQNGVLRKYQTTTVPQLTVTNTPDKYDTMEEFICYVGYQGELEELEYGMWINAYYRSTATPPVDPGTPPSVQSGASVPKTGDNTPLTALLLLLGISLAGATLLVGMRRRQGHP